MADQDRERELEKLRLGKPSLLPRRRRKDAAPPVEEQAPPPPVVAEPAPTPGPVVVTPPVTPVVTPPVTPPVMPVAPAPTPPSAPPPAAAARPARATRDDDRTIVSTAAPVEPAAPAAPREPWSPPVTGMRAVALVGLVAGLLLVGLTTGSLQLCEAVRGTPSCGGAGYLFLTAIVVGVALLGGLALAALQVSDPRGTSALAVGVVAVVVLLVLVPVIFSWTMVLVIPVLSVLAFLGSHWLTLVSGDESPAWERPARGEAHRR